LRQVEARLAASEEALKAKSADVERMQGEFRVRAEGLRQAEVRISVSEASLAVALEEVEKMRAEKVMWLDELRQAEVRLTGFRERCTLLEKEGERLRKEDVLRVKEYAISSIVRRKVGAYVFGFCRLKETAASLAKLHGQAEVQANALKQVESRCAEAEAEMHKTIREKVEEIEKLRKECGLGREGYVSLFFPVWILLIFSR
ncbi:hypothetical protein C0991_009530, partial [Blastosporella zonata]